MTRGHEPCGYTIFCDEPGAFSVLSDIGGYFGNICPEHADEMNARMERVMDYKRTRGARIHAERVTAMPSPGRIRMGTIERIHRMGGNAYDGIARAICRVVLSSDPSSGSPPPLVVATAEEIPGLMDVIEEEYGDRVQACPICWRDEWGLLEIRKGNDGK